MTIGGLSGHADISFDIEGYDDPIHLLSTFQAGTYWISAKPNWASNIYVNWHGYYSKGYDVMSVDWYCEDNADKTYWTVLNWDDGYAGFQETGTKNNPARKLLMSLWDLDDGTQPTIEYVWNGRNGRFGGEGTGVQVFSDYPWKWRTWYTMRVQHWVENGKTYFGQWIREEGGEWLNTAIISYPKVIKRFTYNSFFQEDWAHNNLYRSSRLRNMYARQYETEIWESWDKYYLSSMYIPVIDHTDSVLDSKFSTLWDYVFWDVTFGIDYALGSIGDYIWVQNGGGDYTPGDKKMPNTISVKQNSQPDDLNWLVPAKTLP